jgi:HEAT repeat protein
MPGLAEVRKCLTGLEKSDDNSRLPILRTLRQLTGQEWADVPADLMQRLLKTLASQLRAESKQQVVQKEIATILGHIGARSRPALPQLIELLQDSVPLPVREAAVMALGRIGKPARTALECLLPLVEHARPAFSIQVVRTIGNIGCGDERVRSALLGLWSSPTYTEAGKAQVAIALCKLQIDAKNLVGTLTRNLMSHKDAIYRKAAIEALARCSKNALDVVPALLAASTSDTSEAVRQMAQAGLDQMGLTPEIAVHLCAKQLRDSCYAEAAIRKSGAVAIPALIEALESDDAGAQVKAGRILGCLGELGAAAVPALKALLNAKDREVRLAAAKGLWNITNNAEIVVPTLVSLLDESWTADADSSEARRMFLQTVMEALGRIGPPAKSAKLALLRKTTDKCRHISESACNSLRSIEPANFNPKMPYSHTWN